jgi:hypothetical protein
MPFQEKVGHERLLVSIICFLAACRVFVFSAAFPLFNNVDEQAHFDLVYKYSIGQFPKAGVEPFHPDTTVLIALYGSPEYLYSPHRRPAPPPVWTLPNARESTRFQRELTAWQQIKNHETGAFPTYYAVAGLWCAIGQWVGIGGGHLPYWIRVLNTPLFVLLVWLAYRSAWRIFPDDSSQRLTVPLFIAFFPQDLFYSINCDVMSPLLFAWVFLLLLSYPKEAPSHRHYALIGLVAAAALLTKLSNITVFVLLLVFFLVLSQRLGYREARRQHRLRFTTLLATMAVPVALWLGRNYIVLDDVTASSDKVEFLGWTLKPLGELWDHPLRTYAGLSDFLNRLTTRFWRGELVWYRQAITSVGMDAFYVASSAIFLLVCSIGALLRRKRLSYPLRFALTMSFSLLIASILLLAVLSCLFDFGDCLYPSRERPYFVQGRLISGALMPFALLYICGLQRIISMWLRPAYTLLAVVLIVAGIIVSEVALTTDVFSSAYNWYHLQ